LSLKARVIYHLHFLGLPQSLASPTTQESAWAHFSAPRTSFTNAANPHSGVFSDFGDQKGLSGGTQGSQVAGKDASGIAESESGLGIGKITPESGENDPKGPKMAELGAGKRPTVEEYINGVVWGGEMGVCDGF
jgi:hypothetical protein